MISKTIIDELRAISGILSDDPDSASEGVLLATAADKLAQSLPLTEAERTGVVTELLDWDTKDAWAAGARLRLLWAALAELGGLEEYDPAIVRSHRPRTWKHRGKVYVV